MLVKKHVRDMVFEIKQLFPEQFESMRRAKLERYERNESEDRELTIREVANIYARMNREYYGDKNFKVKAILFNEATFWTD